MSLAIAACGGGGGGESTSNTSPNNDPAVNNSTNNNTNTNNTTPQTPVAENNGLGVINNKLAAPVVNASVAKAGRFLFKWDFVPNAAYYRLMKSVDGKQPYQQVGEKLLTNSTTEDISTFEQDWANANYIMQACDAEGCSLSNKIYSGNVMLDMIAYVKDKAFSQRYDELVKSSMNSNISSFMTIHGATSDSFNIYQKIDYTRQCWVDPGYLGSCPSAYQKNFLFSNTVSGDDWRFVESNDSKPKDYVTDQDIKQVNILDTEYPPLSCQGEGCLVVENGKIVQGYSAEKVEYHANFSTGYYGGSDTCVIKIVSPISIEQTWYSPSIPKFCSDFAKNKPSTDKLVTYKDPRTNSTTPMPIFMYVKPFTHINYISSGSDFFIYTSRDGVIQIYEYKYQNQEWVKNYEQNVGTATPSIARALSSKILLLTNGSVLTQNKAGNWQLTAIASDSNKISKFSENLIVATNDSGGLNIYHFNTEKAIYEKQGELSGSDQNKSVEVVNLAKGLVVAKNNSGTLTVYRFNAEKAIYEKQGELKSSNFDSEDGFGTSIAVSDDGLTIAVGAPYEDSAAVGINGDQSNNKEKDSGAVYVFRFINNEWKQIAYVKATNTGANDNFGSSVGLSPDGKRLVVFAPNEASASTQNTGGNQQDNSKPKAGAVYVY